MINVRLQIGKNGTAYDTYSRWGLIYLSSDHRFEAPLKKRESTTYAEQEGENLDTRSVRDAFDYKVKFLVTCDGKGKECANAKIAAFNADLYDIVTGSDILDYKEVTFYNDYKRVKIVGIPSPIAEATDFYRRESLGMDCVQVEFTIRVCDPGKCDFNI